MRGVSVDGGSGGCGDGGSGEDGSGWAGEGGSGGAGEGSSGGAVEGGKRVGEGGWGSKFILRSGSPTRMDANTTSTAGPRRRSGVVRATHSKPMPMVRSTGDSAPRAAMPRSKTRNRMPDMVPPSAGAGLGLERTAPQYESPVLALHAAPEKRGQRCGGREDIPIFTDHFSTRRGGHVASTRQRSSARTSAPLRAQRSNRSVVRSSSSVLRSAT
jgi:hypothetical protein